MAIQRILNAGCEGACSECDGHGRKTEGTFWDDRNGGLLEEVDCNHCQGSGYEPPTPILSCWEWLRNPAV